MNLVAFFCRYRTGPAKLFHDYSLNVISTTRNELYALSTYSNFVCHWPNCIVPILLSIFSGYSLQGARITVTCDIFKDIVLARVKYMEHLNNVIWYKTYHRHCCESNIESAIRETNMLERNYNKQQNRRLRDS